MPSFTSRSILAQMAPANFCAAISFSRCSVSRVVTGPISEIDFSSSTIPSILTVASGAFEAGIR